MTRTQSTDDREPARFTRRTTLLVAVAGLFWVLLFAAGFPPPSHDDLFFIGGAVELQETGRLANPWLRFWNPVAADRYFFHPAFHAYVLAGWIGLFGLSARSLLALQSLAGAAASACTILLLRRYGFSGAAAAPVFMALILLPQGMRPNALGLAFLAAGLWLLSGRGAARQLAGLCLLGASVAIWTALLVYAVPLGAAVALGDWLRPDPPSSGYAVRRLGLALVAALATFGLFLASIRFRFGEFLADFGWHARLRRVTDLGSELRFQLTNGYSEILYVPLYLLLLALLLAMAFRWRRLRVAARVFTVALAVASTANILIYARSMHYSLDLFAWIGVAALVGELPAGTARKTATAATVAVFALTQSYTFLQILGTRREPAETYVSLREQVPAGRMIGVDETAARYVFDYRLPDGAFYWNYSVPPPQNWPRSVREKPPGVIWALALTKSGVMEGLPPYERVRLFGREFHSLPARPFQVVLVDE